MQDDGSTRSMPLLQSQSLDKMDFQRMLSRAGPAATSASPTSRAVLTRPRPEIVLRWKRFAVLVLLGAALISAVTVTLWVGIPLTELGENDDEEAKIALFNSYSGVIMGFAESGVSQLLGYLFPVFIVYLHNLKWSRLDDPATRPISKAKKTALLLFFPIVMVAIGNSLSAVQTNKSGGDSDGSRRARRLEALESAPTTSALDETLLRTVTRGIQGLDRIDGMAYDDDLRRVAAGSLVAVGFTLRHWRDELPVPVAATTKNDLSLRVTRADPATGVRAAAVVAPETSVQLLAHGLRTLQQFASDLRVDLALPDLPQKLDALSASSTPHDLLDAVVAIVASPSGPFNVSGVALELSREQLHPHVQLESLTLELPLAAASASVSCGRVACTTRSAAPLTRLRSLVAASRFTPACRPDDSTACEADQNVAFLYSSFVSSTASDPIDYKLTLTFSKLSWAFDDRTIELCSSSSRSADALEPLANCSGLALQLPHSQRHLILPAGLSPASLLSKTSPSNSLRLVELVQPPVVVDSASNQLAAVTLTATEPLQPGTDISVDVFASFLRENRLEATRAAMAATLRVTALLFVFQNAIVAPAAGSPTVAWQRHLLAAATSSSDDYEVFVSNTHFGAIATWIACGILFVLSALVLLLPNARARLEPPKGGNARAERFVAVQTEEVYPNLVYKKRFRIGKTGEKIKFREFAVESVTLHHKMEEDEQIQL